MEYFKEKNGRYFAKGGATRSKVGSYVGIVMLLAPLVIGSIVYLQMPAGKGGSPDTKVIVAAAGILVLSNVISLVLKRAGLGAGITVDQMDRTIKYKRPGTQRVSLYIDSVSKISLKVNQNKAAVLSLITRDDKSHFLNASTDVMMMRQLADELSTLISVTVSEETISGNG